MEWAEQKASYKGCWSSDKQHGLGQYTNENGIFLGYFFGGVLTELLNPDKNMELIRKLDEYDDQLTQHEVKFRSGAVKNTKTSTTKILGSTLNNIYMRKLGNIEYSNNNPKNSPHKSPKVRYSMRSINNNSQTNKNNMERRYLLNSGKSKPKNISERASHRDNIFQRENHKSSENRVHSLESYNVPNTELNNDNKNVRKVTGNEGFLKMTKMQRIRKFEENNKPPREKFASWKPAGRTIPDIF